MAEVVHHVGTLCLKRLCLAARLEGNLTYRLLRDRNSIQNGGLSVEPGLYVLCPANA